MKEPEDAQQVTEAASYFLSPLLERLGLGNEVKEISYVNYPRSSELGEPAHDSLTFVLANGNKIRLLRGKVGSKGRICVEGTTGFAEFEGGEIWVSPEVNTDTVTRAGREWGRFSFIGVEASRAFKAEGEKSDLEAIFDIFISVAGKLSAEKKAARA